MAITVVSSSVGNNIAAASGNPLVMPVPAGVVNGDYLVNHVIARQNNPANAPVAPADWTMIDQIDIGTSFAIVSVRRVDGTTIGTDWVSPATAQPNAGTTTAYRGVDATTPFDVPYVRANAYFIPSSNKSPQPFPVTTVTDGAFVHLGFVARTENVSNITVSSPTGYTKFAEYNAQSDPDVLATAARKEVVTAGLEAPDDWVIVEGIGGDYAAEGCLTLALRPAGGAPPVLPVLSNPTLPVYTP